MKRVLSIITFSILAFLITVPTALGQKENVEKMVTKRIKIVTVDKDGKRVEIDTTLTGDSDLSVIYPELAGTEGKVVIYNDNTKKKWSAKDANMYIFKSKDGEDFEFYTSEDGKISKGKNAHIVTKGDGDTFTIIKSGEGCDEDLKEIFVTIDEETVKSRDGKVIVKSARSEEKSFVIKVDEEGDVHKNIWVSTDDDLKDGKVHITIRSEGEVEQLVLDGDAVITIKDGKVSWKSDKTEFHATKEDGEKKASKEIKEKKVVKKKKDK